MVGKNESGHDATGASLFAARERAPPRTASRIARQVQLLFAYQEPLLSTALFRRSVGQLCRRRRVFLRPIELGWHWPEAQ